MTEKEGLFSIPARLLLTPEHRAKLEAIVYAREVDLADFLSEIVAEYLDAQTDVQPLDRPVPDTAAEMRKRRAELARLRSRSDAAGRSAPPWLRGRFSGWSASSRFLTQRCKGAKAQRCRCTTYCVKCDITHYNGSSRLRIFASAR